MEKSCEDQGTVSEAEDKQGHESTGREKVVCIPSTSIASAAREGGSQRTAEGKGGEVGDDGVMTEATPEPNDTSSIKPLEMGVQGGSNSCPPTAGLRGGVAHIKPQYVASRGRVTVTEFDLK